MLTVRAFKLQKCNLCIALYCIVLYLWYSIVLRFTALYYVVLRCITLYCVVLHCIALYYVVLRCIALYYVVLRCIELYCVVLRCIPHFVSFERLIFKIKLKWNEGHLFFCFILGLLWLKVPIRSSEWRQQTIEAHLCLNCWNIYFFISICFIIKFSQLIKKNNWINNYIFSVP